MPSSDRRIRYPGLLVTAWFAGVIGFGTLLLSLPVSQSRPVTVSEALFTATSAVTVTGLAVVDTSTVWSPFGHAVVLALIQIGGLGVLTVAAFFGIALNRRLGVRSGLLAGAEIGLSDLGVLRTLIRDIVRFVLLTEVVVATLLTLSFLADGRGLGRSTFLGIYLGVAAFNNAGFSPLPGNLVELSGHWPTNLVLAATIVVGGIGFPVVFELRRRWRRPRSWSLHTKVTLGMTVLLIEAGMLLLALIEWANPATLGPLPVDEKLLAAFFHSVSARTAGFNTIAVESMQAGSVMVLVLLMVIGASSASTGGGIKTSTFAVAIRSTLAELRGDDHTTLFDRQVSLHHQRQALALVIAALGTVGTATFALAVLEPPVPLADVLFEAASAFGTVGLSRDLTGQLGPMARLVVIGLMFVGRVGPMTFGTAVLLRGQRREYRYPEESLIIG